MLKPLGDRVLVEIIEEAEQKTAGGLYVPDTAKEKSQRGKVIAVGSGKVLDNGTRIALDVKEGDTVYFAKYGGTEVSLEGKNYSIAARVYSYKAALAVWQDNKLIGVGKPDLEGEMAKRYATLYPEMGAKFYIQPHNQYLYNLAAYGALGLLIFCVGLFYPAWWARRKRAPLLLAQYVSIALYFLVEYTLETQIGLAFVVFFLLLALQGSLPCEEEDKTWRPA